MSKRQAAQIKPVPRPAAKGIATRRSSRFARELARACMGQGQRIGFYSLLFYVAILVFPVRLAFFGTGLDSSHVFASNFFPYTDLVYGRDVVFTFGPLGFLLNPQNIGNNLAVGATVAGVAWLLLIWQGAALFEQGGLDRLRSAVFMVALGLSKIGLSLSLDYFLLALLFLLLIRLQAAPGRRAELILSSLLCGSLLLIKLSAYFIAIVAVVFHILRRIGNPPQRLPREEAVFLGVALLSGPLAYLIYNPSLQDFIGFVRGSIGMTSGYSIAMSLPTPETVGYYLIAVLIAFLVMLGLGLAKRTLNVLAAMELLIIAWVSVKHGFVRADGHIVVFFAFITVISAYGFARIQFTERDKYVYLAPLVVLIGFAIAGSTAYVQYSAYWNLREPTTAIQRILNWDASLAGLETSRRDVIEKNRLPAEAAALIHGKRVLVFPWELSRGLSEEFTLEPLYYFQGYSGYTAHLDQQGAARINRRTAATDRILFEWHSIDERHPLLDVPATWEAMYRNYVSLNRFPSGLIAARRDAPLAPDLHLVQEMGLAFDQWISLPKSVRPLSASLDLKPTLTGRIWTTFYKLEHVWLEVETRSGYRQRFRIVPDVLGSPFPLNWLPLELDSLEQAWGKGQADDPVERIRLSGEGLRSYQSNPLLKVYEDRNSALVIAPERPHGIQDTLNVWALDEVKLLAAGSVDRINGILPPSGPEPITVSLEGVLELSGWLATADPNGTAFDEVYAVVNDFVVRGKRTVRTDVAEYYQNDELARSGFRASIPTSVLNGGIQQLFVFGVTKNPEATYRFQTSYPIRLSAKAKGESGIEK